MSKINAIYRKLYKYFGPQHWWPGDTPFEVMVGCILTQNTAWSNVEKAIVNLKNEGLLSPKKLYDCHNTVLKKHIKPSGFYNIKSVRLKTYVRFMIENYSGSINEIKKKKLPDLREQLLSIKGIGPETADSILLYALDKPSFVVDAYTRRLLKRHYLIKGQETYIEVQRMFTKELTKSRRIFNEYHALIVVCCKKFCRARDPKCEMCPLRKI